MPRNIHITNVLKRSPFIERAIAYDIVMSGWANEVTNASDIVRSGWANGVAKASDIVRSGWENEVANASVYEWMLNNCF